jgi:molecular chaperone DnaJ
MKDYYKVLGVESEAGPGVIKKSYRRLAQKYHPDRNPDDSTAEQKFKEIVEANEILSDPQKRQQYDRSLQGGNLGGGAFEDILTNMFSGGFNPFNRQQQPQKRQAPTPDSATVDIEISLGEINKGGTTRMFELAKKVACQACQGAGGEKILTCNICRGRGNMIQEFKQGGMSFQTRTACKLCMGTGQRIVNPCKKCSGSGINHVNVAYKLTILAEKL